MRREVKGLILKPVSVLVLILLVCSSSVLAKPKDEGFKAVVRHLETHYHAKRTSIPFLGLANLAVKVARPAGVKGFQLAVFEDQDFVTPRGGVPFEQVVSEAFGDGWQPLVRVYSRRDGEYTYIYGRPNGADLKLAVVVLEAREAVVVEATVDTDAAAKFLSKPETIASLTGDRHQKRRNQRETTPEPAPNSAIVEETLCSW
jgi:hypothetical protein